MTSPPHGEAVIIRPPVMVARVGPPTIRVPHDWNTPASRWTLESVSRLDGESLDGLRTMLDVEIGRSPYPDVRSRLQRLRERVAQDCSLRCGGVPEDGREIVRLVWESPPPSDPPAVAETIREQDPPYLCFSELQEEQDEPVTSLWGDALVVPGGGYTLIGGPGGSAKTTLFVNLFFALAAGRSKFLGFPLPGRPVRVLVVQREGSRTRFKYRLAAIARNLGIDPQDLPIYFPPKGAALNFVGNSGKLLKAQDEGAGFVRELERGRYEAVLLDPIGYFFDGDDNSNTDWRQLVTQPLKLLAEAHGIAFCLSDHYGKPSEGKKGRYQLRGAGAKVDDAGAAMRLEIGKGGASSRTLFFDRSRDGELPFADMPGGARMPLLVDLQGGTIETDDREAALPDVPGPATEAIRASEVGEILASASGLMTSGEIVAALLARPGGCGRSQAFGALRLAVEKGIAEKAGRGRYRLPGPVLS